MQYSNNTAIQSAHTTVSGAHSTNIVRSAS
nr:MAG TPA: hypothetical protein [Caudoviricetes sp.]